MPKYAVICHEHGVTPISQQNYDEQMSNPFARWKCPLCGRISEFDDETFENSCEEEENAN